MYVDDKKTGGLLRLHSTYRHDLKCYTSDEGRCQKTAAAFLKGLLQLEGALAPILVIMIRKDEVAVKMLDDSSEAEKHLQKIKERLSELFNHDGDILEKYKLMVGNNPTEKFIEKMRRVGNPVTLMEKTMKLLAEVTNSLKNKLKDEMDF